MLHALDSDTLEIELSFRPGFSHESDAQRLAGCVGAAIRGIIMDPQAPIMDVSLLNNEGLERIWELNKTVPITVKKCVHEMFEAQAQTRPEAIAVCAWDGEFTYKELDRLSTSLAVHLTDAGVASGMIIPLCFEKTKWTSVAMLGVLKSGAAFALLDSSLPEQRLQTICNEISSNIMLSSMSCMTLSQSLSKSVVPVGDYLADNLDKVAQSWQGPQLSSSLMYAVFTSGSTGKPKGIEVTHENFCSAFYHQTPLLGLTEDSRILDFASHSFDVTVHNVFAALLLGGCVCVPSDGDRKNNIAGAIESLGATVVNLTPSVLRLLDPTAVPGLQTIISLGEPLTIKDASRWWNRCRIINTYGPSECTTLSTANGEATSAEEATRIGKGAGLVTWVVDPDNHNHLLPSGCVGELLLEGPLISRGYIANQEKTAEVFINDPAWLVRGAPGFSGRHGRLYKTGDLVRYDEDGALVFISRKDTQVKIRGQRVELGEIEHCVQEVMPEADQVIAEVIKFSRDGTSPILAAFIHMKDSMAHCDPETPGTQIISLDADVHDQLAKRLPQYMVPQLFFSLKELPMTATGKIDRRWLRDVGSSFTPQQVAEFQIALQGEKRPPRTTTEKQIQAIWTNILGLDSTLIGLDDNFFQLGGDSIAAMKFVGEARQAGIELAVADVWQHPRLAHLARQARVLGDDASYGREAILPFSLLSADTDVNSMLQEISTQWKLNASIISDVYPCTPLQAGIVSLSLKRPGDYIMHLVLELSPEISITSFCDAWETVVRSNAMLRSRIVQTDAGLSQIVTDGDIYWAEGTDLDEYLEKDHRRPMELGEPMARYALIKASDRDVPRCFVWTLHHALYDGWSLPLIIDAVRSAYLGEAILSPTPFTSFIKYLQTRDEAATTNYWRRTLEDCSSTPFPPLPPSVDEPIADEELTRRIVWQRKKPASTTTANLIQAAWALVVGNLTGSDDVVFGVTVSGRSAPVVGIDHMVGPTIATIPMRVRLSKNQTVSEYLHMIQRQTSEMIPFEQAGLQQIAKVCPGSQQACLFQTLLVLQPERAGPSSNDILGRWRSGGQNEWINTYALVLEIGVGTAQITVTARYDSKVIASWTVQKLLQRLELAMHQLSGEDNAQNLLDTKTIAQQELNEIWQRNSVIPEPIERCVHDLIIDYAQEHLDDPAVSAWDGDLTYGQLNWFSAQLATQLAEFGVRPGTLVPLYFEKSMWTTVAMLGVLRAGCGFVLLDPSLPENRHAIIVREIGATLVLSSPTYQDRARRLVSDVFVVHSVIFESMKNTVNHAVPNPISHSPLSIMYVVYTSGSTGTPKGVTVTHTNFSSALHYQMPNMGITAQSRVFNFASYAFDASILDTFFTLTAGGCLCVPNDQARRDNLPQSIAELRANAACITPSVARLLSPEDVPTLRTLLFGGEAVRDEDVRRWWGHVEIINLYGPSECTPISVINRGATRADEVVRIGRGSGVVTWVVDPEDHDNLLPLGYVGELLLEGPLIGLGYLNDPIQTREVVIENPSWLLQGTTNYPGRHGRLYKTGDLVRYDEEGSLVFVGRKDTQVKIRGQRVNLSEVEYWVRDVVPEASQVIAEVITPEGEGSQPTLVAFLQINQSPEDSEHLDGQGTMPYSLSAVAEARLASRLPSYMIPRVLFSLHMMPMTISGKTDRRALRQIGGSFSLQQLVDMQRKRAGPKRQPNTQEQVMMQKIWANILRIEPSSIGLDDSFFHLGGDSIAIMRVVSAARKLNMNISVTSIFNQPRLVDVAANTMLLSDSDDVNTAIAPFSLLSSDIDKSSLVANLADQWKLGPALIEDIYPCTPLQEGILSLSAKQPGDYTLQAILELSPTISLSAFRSAWDKVVKSSAILRTRIAHHGAGLLQVVLDEPIVWVEAVGLDDYLRDDEKNPMTIGQPLARYALIHDDQGACRWFVWTIHHALYDGWSIPLLLNSVENAYRDQPVETQTPFKSFINYLQQRSNSEATEYWREELEDCNSAIFPVLPSSIQESSSSNELMVHQVSWPQDLTNHITQSNLLRAAWALVASGATNSTDVVFGVTSSGRSAPVDGIDNMTGPTIATVPVQVKTPSNQTVSAYLEAVQQQATEMIPYEQFGLQQISKISSGARHACTFQTLLVVQPEDASSGSSVLGNWLDVGQRARINTYALLLEIQLGSESITAMAHYDTRTLDSWTVQKLLHRLDLVMHDLVSGDPMRPLSAVKTVTEQELDEIWQWNSVVPTSVERSFLDMFEEKVQAQPEAPAICASDGDLTYTELDKLSNQLASLLLDQGVGPNTLVPLCFEKSMWAVVAVLGVLKAHGGFIFLSPSLPKLRLRDIVEQISPTIMLTSLGCKELGLRLANNVLPIHSQLFNSLPEPAAMSLEAPDATSTMYIVFTSGSTGLPKGVTVTYGNVASALYYQNDLLGLSAQSRMYDFASYSFDISISNLLITLSVGGCLCIPSEEDRLQNLSASIARMGATVVSLTPSVSRMLSPADLPCLQSIIFAGEALHAADAERWWGHVQVINAYGPSECTPYSTVNPKPSTPDEATRLGRGAGQVTWVVDPEDVTRLLPPGYVGELLLEGPLVGGGYLKDEKKTAAAFIKDPAWLVQGTPSQPGRHGLLYKTGDLVRYCEDGSLSFVSRKDEQVKIRGQRVELKEVEHRVQQVIQEAGQVVVEVIYPQVHEGGVLQPVLAAFLNGYGQRFEKHTNGDSAIRPLPIDFDVEHELAKFLPSYMIPTIFFSVSQMPMTVSGKIDRRALRDLGGSFTIHQLNELRKTRDGPRRPPSTSAEQLVQMLWSSVLGMNTDMIGLDDHFFRLGGDSIAAMRLVSEAHKASLELTVAEIFQHPTLEQMARNAFKLVDQVDHDIPPFSLLDHGVDIGSLIYGVDPSAIEDAYPCTPIQEGLFSLSSKRPGDYIMRMVLELSPTISLSSFCAAWESVVRSLAILRTRIVHHNDNLLQIVLHEDIRWIHTTGLDNYLNADSQHGMNLGEPLTRYALIKDDEGLCKWFVWTAHHALYDGWSLPRLVGMVNQAYLNQSPHDITPTPFRAFVKHLQEQDDGTLRDYWQNTLESCDSSIFPALPPSVQEPVADKHLIHSIPWAGVQQVGTDITTSNLIRAAWALVMGAMTSSSDVVFGVTVSGRNAPVGGIDNMIGPTIATVPVRVQLPQNQSVSEYLSVMQRQAIAMIPFEQTGLQRIAKFNTDCYQACQFQTLLVIQPGDEGSESHAIGQWQNVQQQGQVSTYALILEIGLGEEKLSATARYDPNVIKPWMVNALLERLELVLQDLANGDIERPLSTIKMVTERELNDIWGWNESVPTSIDRFYNDIFAEQAKLRPNASAVCAWDGELTYSELDQLSMQLASHLVNLGIAEDTLVPLCFEKSMWATVAMLGVIRAGGGLVMLDPALPEKRLLAMIHDIGSEVLLSSVTNMPLSMRLSTRVVQVGQNTVDVLNSSSIHHLPRLRSSSSALYGVFTSGSTGTPKGIVVTHANMSSALHHQQKLLGFTHESRVLDFASYSFDVAVHNTLATLAAGGCLCIPSDEDRKGNLDGVIRTMRVTIVNLTPTVSRLIDPSSVPELETLISLGEALTTQDATRWWGKCRLINTYGPAECTPISTIAHNASNAEEASGIGEGAGLITWIVDPDDHNRLLPIGCVGELLLEGPLVSRGYLNDPHKTAASFIADPTWLLQGAPGRPGRSGRLYKTGDLVRYNENGTLVFIGRKDIQVKIRGQRVDLGEVEHWMRVTLPDAVQVIVEVAVPQGEGSRPMMIAFVEFDKTLRENGNSESALGSAEAVIMPFAPHIQNSLAQHLPSYMIPEALVSLDKLPLTATGKTDRKRLRLIAATFSVRELVGAQERNGLADGLTKPQPTTPMERQMQTAWANVLGLQPSTIGLDDSFFKLGGDSIGAMKLVGAMRKTGAQLMVADIFHHPTLRAMAQLDMVPQIDDAKVVDEDVLDPLTKSELLSDLDSLNIGLPSSMVAEIRPLTQFQEDCIQIGTDNPREFCNYFYLDLDASITVSLLQENCSATLQRFSILRASYPILCGRFWQVTPRHVELPLSTHQTEGDMDQSCRDFILGDIERFIPSSAPFALFFLTQDTGRSRLIVRLSHAQYDGISLPTIFRSLIESREVGLLPKPMSFSAFMSYTHRRRFKSMTYWRELLKGSSVTPIVSKLLPVEVPMSPAKAIICESDIFFPQQIENITPATILTSAWAIILAKLTGESDVVYGRLVAGRNSPVEGVENIVGPCVNIVPVRVKLDSVNTPTDLLAAVQEQFISIGEADSLGLRDICEHCTDWPLDVGFDTAIQHQNIDDHPKFQLNTMTTEVHAFDNPYVLPKSLYMFTRPRDGGVHVQLQANTHIAAPETVSKLLEEFGRAVEHLLRFPNVSLSSYIESIDLDTPLAPGV